MLASHNSVRDRVREKPLKWSAPLAEVAQQWANRLIENGQFVHSHNPKYGENLYEIEGDRFVQTPAQSKVNARADRPKKCGITTILPIAAIACADTTRRSCGATRGRSGARWREGVAARFGYANTTRRGIGSAGNRISEPAAVYREIVTVHSSGRHGRTLPWLLWSGNYAPVSSSRGCFMTQSTTPQNVTPIRQT